MATMETPEATGAHAPSARAAARGRRWEDARSESPERMFAAFLAEGPTADDALRFLVAMLAWPIGADAAVILRGSPDEPEIVAEFMAQIPAWTDPETYEGARSEAGDALRAIARHRFESSDTTRALPPWCAWSLGSPTGEPTCLMLFITTDLDADVIRPKADRVVDLLAVGLASPARQATALGPPVHLSMRQAAILRHLAEDLTMRQIASRIGYSESTVRMESLAIYRALGVHDRRDAVNLAITVGLIPPSRA